MKKKYKNTILRKPWKEFRSTGLLLPINQILHIFGWAICLEVDADGEVLHCYPARVRFRGFKEKSVSESYLAVSKYMEENAFVLREEAE